MGLRGVVTTGIYCQANCKARPSPSNVRRMRNAVEAQTAGFRPCLLCRPDRLPGLGIEQPAAKIASAVRLIAEGFLDSATTEQLADRIGYSTRHLVRLFQEHIGATPDFVARSRRAHLARRLIDESHLSISQIAFAAGFLSIRQMNRVMQELFGFSPSELRQKRRRGDALDPLDGGLRLRLPYSGRLDGQSLIRYLGARAIPGVGPWTSHLIAARAMGQPDAFASSDLGLRKAAARLLGRSEPLSTRDMEALSERSSPYRSTAMAHLWMSPTTGTRRGPHAARRHRSNAERATT
jgi:methylphosphotriester-DNA--protein-cysteine methyltransferase